MAKQWSDTFSYLRGAVQARDRAFVVLAKDELVRKRVPHGLCLLWEAGKWKEAGVANWLTVGIQILPDSRMIVLGEAGDVLLYGDQGQSHENIPTNLRSAAATGLLTGMRVIDGKAYACGMRRQVWRRDGPGEWIRIDDDACREAGKTAGFNAIDGYSGSDLFAVGFGGEIWRFSSGAWAPFPSPTRRILSDVCCAPDGMVYACGQNGVLLRGTETNWSIIPHEATQDDFWSLCWHEGRLYVSTTENLWTLDGDWIEPVEFETDPPRTFYHLSSRGGHLWSIGPKDVMAFDGQSWKRID